MKPLHELFPAHTPAYLPLFRALCEEYQRSLPFSLEFQGFEGEMRDLPGKYAPPQGRMYVAVIQVHGVPVPVGCGALRPLEPGVAELKRMYVSPEHRGHGIARAIGERLIDDARQIGYQRIKLDTSGDMLPAQALYTSLGFVPTDRYNDDPMEDTLYYVLEL